jgi:hypothetical protein
VALKDAAGKLDQNAAFTGDELKKSLLLQAFT